MEYIQLSERHGVLMYDDVFEGNYLNIHIIYAQHYTYIVDTGLGYETYQDIQAILEKRQRNQPIRVINSHDHWDHVWANGYFEMSDIIAHSNCYESLKSSWEAVYEENHDWARGSVKMKLPTILFDTTLWFPEDELILGYAPGHTLTDIYVYDTAERVLNVGDNIGDTEATPLPDLDASKSVYRASINRFKALNPTLLISGHNRVLPAEFLDTILGALDASESVSDEQQKS